jgi:hypothetical protein
MEKCYLLKLFQEWGEEGIKENDGEDKFNYDIFDIRTFVNAKMYHQDNSKRKMRIIFTNYFLAFSKIIKTFLTFV